MEQRWHSMKALRDLPIYVDRDSFTFENAHHFVSDEYEGAGLACRRSIVFALLRANGSRCGHEN